MPVVKQELPPALKPFEFHGLDLSWRESDKEARADCPWCGREGKLYVSGEDGRYHCKVCGESGNAFGFMRRLWADREWGNSLDQLAEAKRLTPPGLAQFGVGVNPVSGDIVCPGFDPNGKLNQLYRWTYHPAEKRHFWNMAKGTTHWIIGADKFDPEKPDVYLCEGLFDAVALWEALSEYMPEKLETANIVATPSATVFHEQWCPLFAGKRVFFLYDNDHPDKNGRLGALEGTKHAINVLVWADEPPAEMQWLVWGKDEGYDPDLKSGFDLRDLLTGYLASLPPDRGLERLFSSLQPVPADWVEGAKKKGKPLVEPLPCSNYQTLLDACGRGLAMHPRMEVGLSVMLAAGSSVDLGMDQLWMKFIGPPACGKTTLADGMLIARRYAVAINIMTGLHSGVKGSEEKGEADKDFSVMAKVKGKAAIIKDLDTLIQAENRTKILADFRDAYDRNTATHYKTGTGREYTDHSFVSLWFGTESARVIDRSDLGQRFLDCIVMDGVDEKIEHDIIQRKKLRYRQIMGSQSVANGDRFEGKDLLAAKRLVGGYLIHLRQNIKYLVEDISRNTPERALDEIEGYAKFVAKFRARPSTDPTTEEQTVELGGRLWDQLTKLGTCLAAVLNKDRIDSEVLKRIKQIALDTCRGKTLDIARHVHKAGQKGADVTSLAVKCSMTNTECKHLLMFLKKIDVLEPFAPSGKVGLGASSNRWRFSRHADRLYKKVLS